MASGYGLAGGELPQRNWNQIIQLLQIQRGVKNSTLIANGPPGPSRCFPFWQELLACYVVNTDTGDMSGGRKCLPALEDYYECLHHKKEVSEPQLHLFRTTLVPREKS